MGQSLSSDSQQTKLVNEASDTDSVITHGGLTKSTNGESNKGLHIHETDNKPEEKEFHGSVLSGDPGIASVSGITGSAVESETGSIYTNNNILNPFRQEYDNVDNVGEPLSLYSELVYTSSPQIAMPEIQEDLEEEVMGTEGLGSKRRKRPLTLRDLPSNMDVELKAQLVSQLDSPTPRESKEDIISGWAKSDRQQFRDKYEEQKPIGTYDSDTEDALDRIPESWEIVENRQTCCHKFGLCCCCCCVKDELSKIAPEGVDPKVAFERHLQASRDMEYAPPEWFQKFERMMSVSSIDIDSDDEHGKAVGWKDSILPVANLTVLFYTGDIVDKKRGRNLYFTDGKRRIDYVLVFKNKQKDPEKEAEMEKVRQVFERNLEEEGLDLEHDIDETGEKEISFTKIHAPFEVLCRYAEIMKNRMPIKEVPIEVKAQNFWEMMTGYMNKLFSPFELNAIRVPPMPKKFTHVFERDKEYLFAIPEKREQFFSHGSRNRIVDYILRRKRYSDDQEHVFAFGIKRLLNNGTYEAAYPLHEGSWKPYTRLSMRRMLYENWAMWQNWYKFQPLDYIRVYFGEKIGIYFAWLGYYTYMLLIPSVVGLAVFIYGVATINQNVVADEACSEDFTMCPLCDLRCPFWNYSALCSQYRATHVFDNGATVFFAFFVSLWGTLFLEFWKREEAGIQFKWNLMNFEEEEEPPRPEYIVRLANSRYKKKHQVTGVEEPYLPFWRHRFPVYFCSFTTVIFLCLVAIGVIIGVIVYRMSVQSALYLSNNELIYSNASMVTSATAALINLVVIFILNFIYSRVAVKLTEWECWRTQSEYDNSLTFKLYFMQFVNYYSSIFYIAFFKGRFAGRPGDYNTIFGARQQECQGSCLTELCVQLAIIFVGKQLIQNNFMEIFFPRIKKWAKDCLCGFPEEKGKRAPWEKDYELEEMGPRGLFDEYLEMLVQFGFVTLFVAAFPLAPLFALLNNIIEIRADANKFVTQYRRPMAARAATIGVWYSILYGVSRFAILSNAFIIAITSNFIHREVYKRGGYSPDGSMKGFVNNSLAYFNVSDLPAGTAPADPGPGFNGTQFCRYTDYREPPWAPDPYAYTTQYWHIVAAQFIFVVVFENVVIILTSLLAYVIPDMPQKLKEQVRRENYLTNEIILKTELEIAKGQDGVLDDGQMSRIRRRARLNMNTRDVSDGLPAIPRAETVPV